MRALGLAASQIRYLNRSYWRNPAAAFFTFAMPLMFLVIFAALLGHYKVQVGGKTINQSTYYVGTMAAWGVISTCFTNNAVAVATQREAGILKRTRGTPLPPRVYFSAKVIHSVLVGALLVALTVAFGALAYHASVPSGSTLVRFVVAFVVGSACFSALGFAITSAIPNADAAPVVVNAIILPLLFLSGVFIPLGDNSPNWILWVARVFPVRHFASSMQAGFLGTTFHWSDVLIGALWGAAGLLVAIKRFSWEPRR